jgi:hypothetical protein
VVIVEPIAVPVLSFAAVKVELSLDSWRAHATVAALGEPDAISVRMCTMIESASKVTPVSIESPFTAEEPVSDWIATELTVDEATSTSS